MIEITQRFRPFSLIAGSECLIPGTRRFLKAFADRIEIGNEIIPTGADPASCYFSLQQDLERDCVWIFGEDFKVQVKAFLGGIDVILPNRSCRILGDFGYKRETQIERLFLGVTKTQDWDLMQRRSDLKEFLPILYSLAQKTPKLNDTKDSDSLKFFQESFKSLKQGKFKEVTFKKLFSDLYDRAQQGSMSEVNILPSLFILIRSLFIQESSDVISVFPNNPFCKGRLIGINLDCAVLDLQWSKSELRQMIIRSKKDAKINFVFSSPIKSFRVRLQENQRGVVVKSTDPFILESGKVFLLDRFYS